MEDDIFLNAFALMQGVGPVTLRALKSRFGSFRDAWRAPVSALADADITMRTRSAIGEEKAHIDPEKEFTKLEKHGVWMMTVENADWPPLLNEIPNPPSVLYGRGSRVLNHENAIAIVGTRKPTQYGIRAARDIAASCARAGLVVISGLAEGIDGLAHEAALEEKATTIAVLGSGVDDNSVFPVHHRALASRIAASQGTVISEYPLGTKASKGYFPQRNRIISGLARGVAIVEAQERSGALITAEFALQQNREVFAVPGSIYSPSSRGTNRLIQQGAKAVLNAEDIFLEMGIEYAGAVEAHARAHMGQDEARLLTLLEIPRSIDELKIETGLPAAGLISLLSLLELKGLIRAGGDDSYQKS